MILRFADLPIARKLLVIGLAAITLALALNYAISLATMFFLMRADIVADVGAQSRVLVDNAAAALAFEDPQSAAETLASLRENPSMDAACLYDHRRLVAKFERRPGDMPCPAVPPSTTEATLFSGAAAVTPVSVSGLRIGVLYVHANYEVIWTQLRAQALGTGLALLASGLAAILLVGRLSRTVAAPVSRLAKVAAHVSMHHDYGVRGVRESNDEIGALVDAFNEMLMKVQERDTALSRTNIELSREIVERQRIEQERVALLERERQANRLKDEFLAALSHELRTPLNAILGWTQILRSQDGMSEKENRGLASVERNARAQARMIEDLLDISRIVTGKLRLSIQAVDPVAALEAALDVIRPMSAAKHLEVTSTIDLPACMVSADPDRFQQVLWNLLSNAVKFTPPDGRVSVSARCVEGMVEIEVSDTGVGIAPGFLPHVFDRFRQADGSTTRQYGGLGLGLSIVHELMELHGGTATAFSHGPGRGARFAVRFPIMTAAPRPQTIAPAAADSPLLRGARVLVVDDDPDAREIAALALRAAGAEVDTAASAAQAFELLSRRAYSALVCDIGMPETDGYELLRRLHEDARRMGKPPVPAVAMTAYATREDIARTSSAGFVAHVAKPYDTFVLVHAVAQIRSGAGPAMALNGSVSTSPADDA